MLRAKGDDVACRVLVLGACCSGKSSLAEELRSGHRCVIECDDAVLRAAGGVWPATPDENRRLVIEAATAAIESTDVIFLTSWVPDDLLELARGCGFTVVLISVPRTELERRNRDRLAEGGFSDVAHWFDEQLENYAGLLAGRMVDVELDGTLPMPEVADGIRRIAHQ